MNWNICDDGTEMIQFVRVYAELGFAIVGSVARPNGGND
jgi:hypothetical protein